MKDEILSCLSADYPWADRLQYFDSIDSTNTHLKQLAAEDAPHGTVLIADRQSGGRGRLGRSFLSPPGMGIYMSLLLRPQCAPSQLMHLTCASATVLCDALERSVGFRPGIKWTNDLVYGQRKLAGILTELGLAAGGTTDYAIIGIGVNCCQQISDFPPEIQSIAGSLSMVTGTPIHRSQVAAAMMEALWKMSETLLSSKPALLKQYRADCVTIGKEISVLRGSDVRHGIALDVDDAGALVVRYDSGETEAVNSGEVSIRGMYGYV